MQWTAWKTIKQGCCWSEICIFTNWNRFSYLWKEPKSFALSLITPYSPQLMNANNYLFYLITCCPSLKRVKPSISSVSKLILSSVSQDTNVTNPSTAWTFEVCWEVYFSFSLCIPKQSACGEGNCVTNDRQQNKSMPCQWASHTLTHTQTQSVPYQWEGERSPFTSCINYEWQAKGHWGRRGHSYGQNIDLYFYLFFPFTLSFLHLSLHLIPLLFHHLPPPPPLLVFILYSLSPSFAFL